MTRMMDIHTYRKAFLARVMLLLLACLLGGNALAWEDGKLTSSSQDQLLLIADITDDSNSLDSSFIPAASLFEFKKYASSKRTLPAFRASYLNIWNAQSIRAPPSPKN